MKVKIMYEYVVDKWAKNREYKNAAKTVSVAVKNNLELRFNYYLPNDRKLATKSLIAVMNRMYENELIAYLAGLK